jgi:hypothetical protein
MKGEYETGEPAEASENVPAGNSQVSKFRLYSESSA